MVGKLIQVFPCAETNPKMKDKNNSSQIERKTIEFFEKIN
jgi:hypothetical protein